MNVSFHEQAWDDYLYWQQTDKQTLKRINLLIRDILRDPFDGIGKPEPLKHDLAGFWSRRITDEHRIVYRLADSDLLIAQCRYHYD
jgi:toxin YoeB